MSIETAGERAEGSRRQRLLHLCVFGIVVAYASLFAATFSMGIWLVDKEGVPIAADFVAFWTAGKLVLSGHASDAYDWVIHKQVAMSNGVEPKDASSYFSFQYPPTFLLLTPLVALVSYPIAMFLWSAIGLPLYLGAIRLIVGGWQATLAALAWPAVFWNIVVGQTGFLTAALLGAGIALIDRRPALAGILFGLLTYKPQFGLLIPVALIAGGRWRVVVWAALSCLVLAAASVGAFGPGVWTAFFDSINRINDAILTSGGTDFRKLQSLYGYLRAQGFDAATAWTAHAALIAVLAIGIAWIWRSDRSFDLKAAALAVATILASPYAFIYDFVTLAIPLAFLGRAGFSNREAAVVLAAVLCVGWGPSHHLATGLVAGLLVLGLVVMRAATAQPDGFRQQLHTA